MILILLGPPGAGKGTQAERIAGKFSVKHLSTGDLLRAAVAEGTELGKSAQGYMNAGKLLPDDVILGIINDYLTGHKDDGILFDGFPRTVTQAEGLKVMLAGAVTTTVSLEVPDREVIERLSSRRVCRSCGKVYNSALGIMPEGGKCDCGSEEDLYQRDDDKRETITNRLRVYHEQTEPIIEFYRDQGTLITIDGSGHPDEIFGRIEEAIG